MSDLTAAVRNAFPEKKVLIAGDLVADQFLHGTISRVSREAPVFILRHDLTETLAGGAANAAVNVAALGGRAMVAGLVGSDVNGSLLMARMTAAGVDCGGVVAAEGIKTTTKVRVLAGHHYAARQQVIRIDYEDAAPIEAAVHQRLTAILTAAGREADAIIISDYNYGAVSEMLVGAAREIAAERNIPLVVDSRFRLSDLRDATTATPNQDEVEQILGEGFTEEKCGELRERLGLKALLVTRGNKGMLLLEAGKPPKVLDAVGPTEPVDVTGAGDTVIAAYALGLASGLSFRDAADIANHAGGVVVMKKGTAAAFADEVIRSLDAVQGNDADDRASFDGSTNGTIPGSGA